MAYQDFAFMHNTLQTLGQCVSVSSGRFSSRSRISLVACNGSIEQQWFADGQRIRSMLNGQCLDASKTGSAVRLQSCDDSIGQQFGRHHLNNLSVSCYYNLIIKLIKYNKIQ